MRRPFCRTELDMLPDGRCQHCIMYRWPPDVSQDAFGRRGTIMQYLKLTMKHSFVPALCAAGLAVLAWTGDRPHTPYVFPRVCKYLIFVQVARSRPSEMKKSV